METHQSVMCSKCFEFVGCSGKLESSLLRYLFSYLLRETDVSVKPCPNCSSSLSQLTYLFESGLHPLNSCLYLMSIPTKLLTQRHWSSILGVSSSNLDDILELLALN